MITKYLNYIFVFFCFIYLFFKYKKRKLFLKDCFNELNKITWISYKEVIYTSLFVLFITLFVSIFIWFIDTILIYFISIIYSFI